jgi:hypothetical protein
MMRPVGKDLVFELHSRQGGVCIGRFLAAGPEAAPPPPGTEMAFLPTRDLTRWVDNGVRVPRITAEAFGGDPERWAAITDADHLIWSIA